MLNKKLDLEQCICLLSEMITDIIDYDSDSDSVIYILVGPEKIEHLKKLISNEKDLENYLQGYGENWKEEGFDITGILSEICSKFNVDIWVDFKENKFFLNNV